MASEEATEDVAGHTSELSPQELGRLAPMPSGAIALAGVSVALLLAAWLLIYLLIYLPRGMVG